jgi:uncharacterized repeat protein (TIGR03803 family)
MMKINHGFTCSFFLLALAACSQLQAQTLNVLYNFSASNNGGWSPESALVQGSDGNFYGTTAYGGSSNDGTIFKITPGGVLTTLVSFNGTNGENPEAAMVQGSDSNFYGTTTYGGSGNGGTIFKMTLAGVLTTLVSFTHSFPVPPPGGDVPYGLVQGNDGNFYGTTAFGGTGNGYGGNGFGTVFKMTPAGVLTTLALFNSFNGADPVGTLVQGSDGNFYGTTIEGGLYNHGTVFMITAAGSLTSLVSFTGANGANPDAGLLHGTDGNFYSTTAFGGPGSGVGYGTIFNITPAGTLTTQVSFNSANGSQPEDALIQGSDGNFYGTTSYAGSGNEGTIFQMTPAGVLTTLISFNGTDGAGSGTSLVQGSDGNFYGTTEIGGSSNDGVVFQLIPPQPVPVLPRWGWVVLAVSLFTVCAAFLKRRANRSQVYGGS